MKFMQQFTGSPSPVPHCRSLFPTRFSCKQQHFPCHRRGSSSSSTSPVLSPALSTCVPVQSWHELLPPGTQEVSRPFWVAAAHALIMVRNTAALSVLGQGFCPASMHTLPPPPQTPLNRLSVQTSAKQTQLTLSQPVLLSTGSVMLLEERVLGTWPLASGPPTGVSSTPPWLRSPDTACTDNSAFPLTALTNPRCSLAPLNWANLL